MSELDKIIKGPWVMAENDGAYVKDGEMATLRIEERATDAELILALVLTDCPTLEDDPRRLARLIAVSPEMLAELNRVRDRLLAMADAEIEGDIPQGSDLAEEARRIGRVIAKALGTEAR